MTHHYLRRQKVLLESRIIANEMLLADLYERRSRALQANQLDSWSVLALAITMQIRNEHLLNASLKAEYQQLLYLLSQ